MKPVINNLCKDEGKLFFCVEVSPVSGTSAAPDAPSTPDAPSFDALTISTEGKIVPFMTFVPKSASLQSLPVTTTSLIVVCPLVTTPLELLIQLSFQPSVPAAPTTRATVTHTLRIDPTKAKWQGRFNRIVRRDAVCAIRNCDQYKTLGRCVFHFTDYLTPLEDDPGLLRGCAYVPTALCAAPPQLRALDETATELPDSPLTAPPRLHESSPNMSAPLWEVPFSIPLRTLPQSLTIVATDTHGAPLPGFETIEHPAIDQLAERVAFIHRSADWDGGYHDWFMARRASMSQLELQRRHTFEYAPTFSIVVPLYQTPLQLFEEMKESVRAQSYPHWELILVNASPENAELTRAIQHAAEADERIKIVTLKRNEGITLNTQAGAAVATGDYLGFLDHDDLIEPNLLFEYVCALNNDPEIDLLYCDEDKLDEQGRYLFPSFKPDFSLDLLRSCNYIAHLLALRTSLYRSLPPQDSSFDGAQDHNLTLMAVEHTRRIHHVPHVLYHWRISATSTAGNADNKRYAEKAATRAIANHLKRSGVEGTVLSSALDFRFRIDYAVAGAPLVSIIIPHSDRCDYNSRHLLVQCVGSIFEKSTYRNFEIVIVEHGSTASETFAYYERLQAEHANVRVVTDAGTDFNRARLINEGMKHARGDYIALLQSNVEVITPQWIELMLGIAQREDVGLVGARLYLSDGTIAHAGIGLSDEGAAYLGQGLQHSDHSYLCFLSSIRNWIAVSSACALTKKSLYQKLGGFEETLTTMQFSDIDFGLKVHAAGLEVVYNPFVEMFHHTYLLYYNDPQTQNEPSQGETAVRTLRERAFVLGKWADYYAKGDPYLSPNFARDMPRAPYFNLK